MATTIDMGESPNVLRDIMEAWAADREPPRLLADDGAFVGLAQWLTPPDELLGGEILNQNLLDGGSIDLLESIIGEDSMENFDGTEPAAAGLLLTELLHTDEEDES